jgi:hypothetical protein
MWLILPFLQGEFPVLKGLIKVLYPYLGMKPWVRVLGGCLQYRQYPVAVDPEEFMIRGRLVDELPIPGPFFVEVPELLSSFPSSPNILTRLFHLLLSFLPCYPTAEALPFYSFF